MNKQISNMSAKALSSIRLVHIDGEHSINCPECGQPRLLVTKNAVKVPRGRTWLSDGDTIFGLYNDLVAADLEQPVASDDPNAWDKENYDYKLMVGECPKCHEEYFVLIVNMIDPAVEVDTRFVESYFRRNCPIPEPTNLIGQMPELNLEWLVSRHDTDRGVALEHIFGPFSLDGKTMKGPYGVAACSSGDMDSWVFGRKFLFELWPQLKALAVEINAAPAA